MLITFMKIKHKKYVPKKCDKCGQNETYLVNLDHGTADLMKAFYNCANNKGINKVHPRQEMEMSLSEFGLDKDLMISNGKITSVMTGNLSKARFHGLIASLDEYPGYSGYYCLTKKGWSFLTGNDVFKTAIVSKVKKMQIGYLVPEELNSLIAADYVTNIKELTKDDHYWDIVPNSQIFDFASDSQQSLFDKIIL